MAEEELEISGMASPLEADPKSNDERAKRREIRRKKRFLKESVKAEEPKEVNIEISPEKKKKKKPLLEKVAKGVEEEEEEEEEEMNETVRSMEEVNTESNGDRQGSGKSKKRKRLIEEAAKAGERGVCYLSRIPPHMDPLKLRQILSQYGDIQRIYLAPENPAARLHRKKAGGFRGQGFSEGWVEFTKKSVAKRVANILNGEQIGGRKRSSFYYDLWNIKYLSKFKWDDLTEEIAYKNAVREQKLTLEISAAKRERDFYLAKVDKFRALSSIEERLKKKQKVQQESGKNSELPVSHQQFKVIRQFHQKQPVVDNAAQSKPRLSKDILAGVFGS